ncbi:MAG: hypothetical protein WCI01_09850 [Chlorobiaceae bacterium]
MLRKVVGPAILLAPVAAPVLHGLTGIAVVGLGLFAAGKVVSKTVKALSAPPKPLNPLEGPPPVK